MKKSYILFLFIALSACSSHELVKITENNSLGRDDKPLIYFFADNQFHLSDGKAYPVQNYPNDEIDYLRPYVAEAVSVLNEYYRLASGNEKEALKEI